MTMAFAEELERRNNVINEHVSLLLYDTAKRV
jgi:hypothetical protein